MKFRSRLHQLSAFSLILLFSLQAGLGLWLHTTYHQQSAKSSASVSTTGVAVHQSDESNINCNCLPDFLTPFNWPATTVFAWPFQQQFARLGSADYGFTSHTIYAYCSLRGPPAYPF